MDKWYVLYDEDHNIIMKTRDIEIHPDLVEIDKEPELGNDGRLYEQEHEETYINPTSCGNEPKPYVPTEDELKAQVRAIRNQYLAQTDKFMITDYPITDDERELYKQYREYLRDYTLSENWWEHSPMTFEEWKSLQTTNALKN